MIIDEDKVERIVFPITFNPVNKDVVAVVKDNFRRLERDSEVGDLFEEPPLVAYRRDKNLRDLLVHSRIRTRRNEGKTHRCGRTRCNTCHHVCSDSRVVGPRGNFSIRCDFTCQSAELIYCIICRKCGELYVGETGRMLAERFREHRQDVIQNREGKEVASHFNSEGHDGIEDMEVLGLKYESSLVMRKFWEQKIIGKLGCFVGRGMNTDFRFMDVVQE